MNHTKTLAIVAVFIAATLVVGVTFATIAATQPAFAVPQKKPPVHDDKKDKARDDGNGNGNGNTVTVLKADNKGSASGFDTNVTQEAENTICTHPSTSCEGTPVANNATDGSTSDGTDEEQ
jgi:hypothetical protein